MVKNVVSFIISFVILMAKMWIFGFSSVVCPTKLCNLVFSLECLVPNGRQALLEGIRLGGSATVFFLVKDQMSMPTVSSTKPPGELRLR